MAAEANFLTCGCHFCTSQLRFPLFREGEILMCPHCGMETLLDGKYSPRSLPAEKYTMEIRNLRWQPGQFGIRYIIGEVAGRSGVDLEWVKIEFKIYNSLDVHVGSASDHLRVFGTGRIWQFKAPVLNPEASHALLADVTCEYGSIYHPAGDACLPGMTWSPAAKKRRPASNSTISSRGLPTFA